MGARRVRAITRRRRRSESECVRARARYVSYVSLGRSAFCGCFTQVVLRKALGARECDKRRERRALGVVRNTSRRTATDRARPARRSGRARDAFGARQGARDKCRGHGRASHELERSFTANHKPAPAVHEPRSTITLPVVSKWLDRRTATNGRGRDDVGARSATDKTRAGVKRTANSTA